uniref:Ig-like domain-containing protein n=1 Tax=Latimeria chalumnae TaxID=7897 RepID=H3BF77_LATCH
AVGQSVLLSVSCGPRFDVSQSLLQWSVKKPDSNRILTYNNGNMQATSGYQDRVQLYPNGSLLLHNLNASDAGSYTVTWAERNGQETRGTIQLIIYVSVSEPQINISKNSTPHGVLTMSCAVNEGTDPSFSWLKDKQTLREDARHQISEGNSSLEIINVTEADCVTYTCVVSNPISRKSADRGISGNV